VMNGNILQAKAYMNQISDEVLQIEFDGLATVEGIEALTSVIVNAKQLMNAVQTESHRLQIAAAQVRLSTDALIHKNHPLWHDYEKTMRQDTEELKRAIEQGQHILASAQQLQQHYAIIRPAVLIAHPPEMNVKVESLIAFFLQQANRPEGRLIEPVNELSRTWDKLFQSKELSAYLPMIEGQHPVYWSLVIGSIIITVLCFVAWLKYQADLGIVSLGGIRISRKDDR